MLKTRHLFKVTSSIFSSFKRTLTMSAELRSLHVLPNETPVCSLDCKTAFETLTEKERLYAHHLSKASYDGSLAVFLQVSPEAAGLFVVFHRLFATESVESLKKKALGNGWTEEEFAAFLVYVAGFYNNSGNYKGFGDSKIVPGVSTEKITSLVTASDAVSKYPELLSTYHAIEQLICSLQQRELQLGFCQSGITTYHCESVTKEDAQFIDRFCKEHNIETWNTRLFKDTEKRNGKTVFRIVNASSITEGWREEEFEEAIVVVERGDYSPLMARAAESLRKAKDFAANDNQVQMLDKYVNHFTTGDLNDHKDGSRFWIKDQNPAKFKVLVDRAEELLERMPWGKAYEKDRFLKPDFTALDVISFAGSGIPAGINIPNYDEIRQNEGFKNVSLSNVISATPKQKMNFLDEGDEDLMFKYHKDSFEVQVGLHELLGHGSGKLFQRNADGTFNFDQDTTNILDGEKITTWYEQGETWGSKFGALSGPYEECRAEAVGYVLCCDEDILKIFGYEGELGQTVKYVNWLSEIRAGLMALEFYNADLQKWGQAHCYARYVLTQVCLEAGQEFVTIEEVTGEDGKPDLKFKLDQNKIDSVGKPAVREFLKKLQHYKTTGDAAGGTALFEGYGKVTEKELVWRNICITRRKPRRLFVQANTRLNGEKNAELVTYPETFEGIIASFVERYDSAAIDDLELCWKEQKKWWPTAFGKH
ncbi:unnamed protein product, partial [Mesorhabditis belari]|uniref:Dipeptidyl peptidase 3 n=1 Tax=Mesorhabditis belari TaxID=2138241 RepID=A0AAF3FGW3_9BILA